MNGLPMNRCSLAIAAATAAHLRLSAAMIDLAAEAPTDQVRFMREQLLVMRGAVEAMQAALNAEIAAGRLE